MTDSKTIVLVAGHRNTDGPRGGCVVHGKTREGTYIRRMFEGINDSPELPGDIVLDVSDASYTTRVRRLMKMGVNHPGAIIHLHVDALPGTQAHGSWGIAWAYSQDYALAGALLQMSPLQARTLQPGVRRAEPESLLTGRAHKVMRIYQQLSPHAHVLLEMGFSTHPYDQEVLKSHPDLFLSGVLKGIRLYMDRHQKGQQA